MATRKNTKKWRGVGFFFICFLALILTLIHTFGGDILSRGTHAVQGELSISFIDVGQGDSILIRTADHAVLIDGGTHGARNIVMDYLHSAGVTRLDYVVATHPHADHIGGLVTVLGRVPVGTVVMTNAMHTTDTFFNFLDVIEDRDIDVWMPSPGSIIQAGDIHLTVLAPVEAHLTDLNNASIVLRLQHGSNSVILTGDAERESEAAMVSGPHNLRACVLNLAHHGSRTSTTEIFLDAVQPRIAVISLGLNNQFGHPHPEVLDRLIERGIAIYRTDIHGTIRMISDGTTLRTYVDNR